MAGDLAYSNVRSSDCRHHSCRHSPVTCAWTRRFRQQPVQNAWQARSTQYGAMLPPSCARQDRTWGAWWMRYRRTTSPPDIEFASDVPRAPCRLVPRLRSTMGIRERTTLRLYFCDFCRLLPDRLLVRGGRGAIELNADKGPVRCQRGPLRPGRRDGNRHRQV